MDINRRQLLIALMGSSVGVIGSNYWQLLSNDSETLSINLPNNSSENLEPSFDIFFTLSKLVTARESLDGATAQRMYPLFINEPWGKEHILSTYLQLVDLLKNSPTNYFNTSIQGKLGAGQSWFASHLLTTWYLGIYFHESSSAQRVAYKTALMFEPTKDILPIPFIDSVGFGGWTEKP